MHNKTSSLLLKDIFPTLTQRQLEILHDYSIGMTQNQIQRKSDCSRQAVERHLSDIRAEFGCETSNEIRTVFLNNLILRVLIISSTSKF